MKYTVCLSVLLIFTSSSICFASETELQQVERQLIAKYKKPSADYTNVALEKDIVTHLLHHPAAFSYGFTPLQNSIGPNILWSPDQKLKFYVFNIGQGEQMREVSTYVQYRNANTIHLYPIQAGEIYDVTQIQVAHQPVYLLQSYYKGRACSGVYEVSALKIDRGKVQAADIFFGKIRKLNKIQIEHDCTQQRDQQQDPSDDYVRLSSDQQFLDLRLVDSQGVAQGKFQRMVLTPKGYKYQATINE